VTWDKVRCIHAAECVRGLPAVFDTGRRPWVQPDQAAAGEVTEVVRRCPTGALRVRRADGAALEEPAPPNALRVAADGPVYVQGDLEVRGSDGEVRFSDTRLALCRCGRSDHKPLCDNSHRGDGFADAGRLRETKLGDDGERPTARLVLKLTAGGPVVLDGPFALTDAAGRTVYGDKAALCRCGASANKPFCDGSHQRVGFSAE